MKFLKGILSIFNIYTIYKARIPDDDCEALKSDWEQVGNYFPIKNL